MSDISYLAMPPRSRTSGYYAALVAVAAVYSITPVSWAYAARCVVYGLPRTIGMPHVLLIGAVVEVVFSVYHFYLAQSIQKLAPNTPEDLALLRTVFIRVLQSGLSPSLAVDASLSEIERRPGSALEIIGCLQPNDPRAIDFRNRIRTWFRKAPWSDITKEAMLEWLSWSCFDLRLAEAEKSASRHTILYEALELIERRSGTKLPDGPMKVIPLRLTMDPIGVWSRPLLLYLFGTYGDMEYLVRIPEGWTPEKGRKETLSAPVVFFHGLGVGLIQYFSLLSDLTHALPSHPLLIPLQPHISQEIWHPRHLKPLRKKETVDVLSVLIEEMGFAPDEAGSQDGGVVFVSHSNGTIAHAWMMKERPELLRRSCFVDPVVFCLWEGDVCYNFVYRSPSNAIELLMWYFVGSELGVANLLQRNFVWSDNILWFEELKNARDPMKTLFLLGGKDAIVDTDRVRLYLHAHGVHKGLLFDPEGAHGAALLRNGRGLSTVVDWVKGEWST